MAVVTLLKYLQASLPGRTDSVAGGTRSSCELATLRVYVIKNPVEATYHIRNVDNFLQNQAYDVLRRVCGKFPYRSNDPNEPTLLDDSSLISKHMTVML